MDLKQPFFAGKLESPGPRLTVEHPAGVRRRMLSVREDALSRPRSPPDDP
jgi:hypothetical protein